MPGWAWPFAVWAQTAGATMTPHMQIKNSFVILIFVSFEEFVSQLYSLVRLTQGKGYGRREFPVCPAQSSTMLGCWQLLQFVLLQFVVLQFVAISPYAHLTASPPGRIPGPDSGKQTISSQALTFAKPCDNCRS